MQQTVYASDTLRLGVPFLWNIYSALNAAPQE